jgi:uncharacterized membrane protein
MSSLQPFQGLAEIVAKVIELAGVAVIVLAILASTAAFALAARRDWRAAYNGYRANLGRGILLGLELLVGSDIIATVTAPLTFETVGLLGLIIVIRTFLSFSLETEIEGQWPWRRARSRDGTRDAGEPGRRER